MEKTNPKYQLFPALSSEEYETLQESILRHGVLQPIIVDEKGEIMDGHHRAAICLNHNIDCPRKVMEFADYNEKKLFIISMNIGRRHLTKDQKKKYMEDLRALGWSIRQIAEATNTSVGTVHAAITAAQEQAGEPIVTTVTGSDGAQRPATSRPIKTDEEKLAEKQAREEKKAREAAAAEALKANPPVNTGQGFTVHAAASNTASMGDTASKVHVIHPPLGTIETLSANIVSTYSREQIEHLVELLSNHLISSFTPSEEIEGGEVTETDVIPAEDFPLA